MCCDDALKMLRKKYEKRVTQINKEFQLVALIDAMNMHPGSTLIWWVDFDQIHVTRLIEKIKLLKWVIFVLSNCANNEEKFKI